MTILLVSGSLDEKFYTELEGFRMQHPETSVLCTDSIEQADQLMQSHPVDLLASDMDLPHENGLELFSRYKKLYPELKYIGLVSSLDFIQIQRLLEIGCCQILRHPVEVGKLMDCAGQLFQDIQTEKSAMAKRQIQFAMMDRRWRFVLEHQFWINLFMTKTSKNIQAVNEHIQMLGLQVDPEGCYRPVLLNILGEKPFNRWDDENGLWKIVALLQRCLDGDGRLPGINATYYDDSRAIFLFPDLSPPLMRRYLMRWLESCKEKMGIHANCCVGRPCSFLMLCDEMPSLLREADLQPDSQPVSWTDGSDDKGNELLIRTLKQYIDEHLDHELSRKELSNQVFLSESYISHVWRSITGSSLKDYVTTVKMERAKEMLRDTTLSVSQIALMLGYTHFSYFSSTFKKKNNLTPAEYRKKFLESR